MEVDRVLPDCGGAFALHINENHGDLLPTAHSAATATASTEGELSGASNKLADRIRAVQWRIVEADADESFVESSEPATAPTTGSCVAPELHCGLPLQPKRFRKCCVYRFEWNDEVYDSVINNMKAVVSQ